MTKVLSKEDKEFLKTLPKYYNLEDVPHILCYIKEFNDIRFINDFGYMEDLEKVFEASEISRDEFIKLAEARDKEYEQSGIYKVVLELLEPDEENTDL